jgi:hypothetical protein
MYNQMFDGHSHFNIALLFPIICKSHYLFLVFSHQVSGIALQWEYFVQAASLSILAQWRGRCCDTIFEPLINSARTTLSITPQICKSTGLRGDDSVIRG